MSIQTTDLAFQHPPMQDQAIELWEAFGFQGRDILWMLVTCAASLSLTPLVAFYLLLVA